MNRLLKHILLILTAVTLLQAGIFDLYGTGNYGNDHSVSASGRGGTSVAYTDTLTFGVKNPALLSFARFTGLETGLKTKISHVSDFGYNESSVRFDYVNLLIPVGSRGGMLIGFNPLTAAKAEYQIITPYTTEILTNSGDIYTVSLGMGYRIYNNLHAGLSLQMLTGGYTQSDQIKFSNSEYNSAERYISHGIDGRRIVLGTLLAGKKLSIGLSYAQTYSMTYHTYNFRSYSHFIYNDPIDTVRSEKVILPNELSAGFTLKLSQMLFFMSDYTVRSMSNPSNLENFNAIKTAHNSTASHSFGAGLEKRGAVGLFVPLRESITYRLGVFYDENRLSLDYRSMGLSGGLGIPFNNFKSRIDVSFIYGLNSGVIFENTILEEKTSLDESFYQIKISVNSIERWFNTRGKYR